jgi:hypothetical protein
MRIEAKVARQKGPGTGALLVDLIPERIAERFAQIFSGINGFNYVCFTMRDSGELQCTGDNHNGQLGDGTLETRHWLCPPYNMKRCHVSLPQPIIAVSVGSIHACAVVGEGAVYVQFSNPICARLTFLQLLLGLKRRRSVGRWFKFD